MPDTVMSEVELARTVLDAAMGENEAGAGTVRAYLLRLLRDMWTYEQHLYSKEPLPFAFDRYDVYNALAEAGLVHVSRDEDGFWDWHCDAGDACRRAADEIVRVAIDHLQTP